MPLDQFYTRYHIVNAVVYEGTKGGEFQTGINSSICPWLERHICLLHSRRERAKSTNLRSQAHPARETFAGSAGPITVMCGKIIRKVVDNRLLMEDLM